MTFHFPAFEQRSSGMKLKETFKNTVQKQLHFTQAILKFSKIHSGNLSQIALPHM